MPQTLMLAELALGEFHVDLEALSGLILSDLGATLCVLRARERTGAVECEGFFRMTDCIAAMGLRACEEAMFESATPRVVPAAIAELCIHSRDIAGHAKSIAEEREGISPENAYLVGLCHAIEELPSTAGWVWRDHRVTNSALAGFQLATEWSLPACVQEYARERQGLSGEGLWTGIVRAAHRRCGESSARCSCEREIHPRLLQAV